MLGLSLPPFWVAAFVLVVPAIELHYNPPAYYEGLFISPWSNLRMLVPAAAALALGGHRTNRAPDADGDATVMARTTCAPREPGPCPESPDDLTVAERGADNHAIT